MMRNNIKLLTCRELMRFNERYRIWPHENDIVVSIVNYNRSTRHPKDKSFSISSKFRKITFSMDAINFWLQNLTNCKFSLFDIQQVVNYATISYMKIDDKTIFRLLNSIEKTLLKENQK